LPVATPGERAAALEALNRLAWTLDAVGRRDLLAAVVAWHGGLSAPRTSHRVLTAAEIVALARIRGMSIGAHTTHHLALTTQPPAVKQQEILGDKTTLETLLGRDVPFFAYPYGDYDASTIAVVKEAGYRAALTVDAGAVMAATNRLLLPRVEIAAADHGRFAERLDQIFAGYPAPVASPATAAVEAAGAAVEAAGAGGAPGAAGASIDR
jgi:peptidoglycan/xylan/chitin deacetylase (PgdA/CDA1 family)